MKKNKIMTIKTILSLAAALTLAAQFFGCSNLSGGSVTNGAPGPNAASGGQNGTGQGGSQETVLITVSGSIDFDGAFPEQIAALVENSIDAGEDQAGELGLDGVARSAFPGVSSLSGVTYEVYAEDKNDSSKRFYDGTVAADGKSYTIAIPICYGKYYYVHITAYKDGIALLSGVSAQLYFDIMQNQKFITNANIKLTAARTATGVGMVELPVNVSELSVASARAVYIDPNDGNQKTIAGAPGTGGNSMIFSIGEVKTNAGTSQKYIDGGLKTGSYLMTFEFYSAADYGGNLLYSFKEAVNVFDNMTTSQWVRNGYEPWLGPDNSGNTACKITSAMVQGYGLTDIYVNSSAANDSGIGNFMQPKKTFAGAVAMLHDDTKNYTIHITGTMTGSFNSNFALAIPSTASAKSLTLHGESALVGDVPQDILSGGVARGALFIESSFPVTIENLKITDGKASYGGGILACGGDLILGKGAYITGNEATLAESGGGGVYFNGAELIMLDGAVIDGNSATGNSGGNRGSGGGVYLCSGKKFTMNGGVIKDNKATGYGGGVYVKSATFTMADGVIGDDSMETPASSESLSSNVAYRGGGVYLGGSESTVDAFFYFTGGKIAYNAGIYGGGGIYAIYCDATIRGVIKCNGAVHGTSGPGGGILAEEKATIRLENCSILKNKTANYNPSNNNKIGGAIYVKSNSTISNAAVVSLKGSVSIPCTGINENDVYLPSVKIVSTGVVDSYPLIIAGKLTGTGTVATITPGGNGSTLLGYDEAIQSLQLGSGVTDTSIANVCGLFAITPNGTEDWTVGLDGKMLKATVYTSANIGSFTYDSIVLNQEYHFVIGSDVDDDKFSSFMGKLCHSSANKISENSTLDLSKATSLDGLTWPSINTGAWLQKFDTVIIGPNFNTNWYNGLNIHYVFLKVKNIVAPSNCANFSSDNGILFNKDKTKIVFYPGGSVREESSYTIPSSVTEIAPYTFYWATGDTTGLMTITIGANVKKIGKYAFPTLARFTSSGTLNFVDKNGWHQNSTSGAAINASDLTAANYKANLESKTLVKE